MMEIFWFEKMQLDGVPKFISELTSKSLDRPSHAASRAHFIHHMRIKKLVFDVLLVARSKGPGVSFDHEVCIGGVDLVHNLRVAPAEPSHYKFVAN